MACAGCFFFPFRRPRRPAARRPFLAAEPYPDRGPPEPAPDPAPAPPGPLETTTEMGGCCCGCCGGPGGGCRCCSVGMTWDPDWATPGRPPPGEFARQNCCCGRLGAGAWKGLAVVKPGRVGGTHGPARGATPAGFGADMMSSAMSGGVCRPSVESKSLPTAVDGRVSPGSTASLLLRDNAAARCPLMAARFTGPAVRGLPSGPTPNIAAAANASL